MRDFDRPLEDSGIADAESVGRKMREEGYEPALVLCSTAARARQTWEAVQRLVGGPSEVRWLLSLYEGDAATYLKALQQAGDAESVLIVGHNPMVEDLAMLLGDRDGRVSTRLRSKGFPTAGLATFSFDGPLAKLKARQADDVGLIAPDDL